MKNWGLPLLTFEVEVSNIGEMEGDETIQLYGIDEYASIIRPQKILLGFKRVTLCPGETKKILYLLGLTRWRFQINAETGYLKGDALFLK